MEIGQPTAKSGRYACIAVFLLASLVLTGRTPQLTSSEQTQAISARGKTIKVDVALVTVPALVTDRQGRHVPDLIISDFHIFEEGVLQETDRLIPVADPFHMALMLDTSGSTKFKHDEIQSAAVAFIEALRPQDRLMIVSFDNEVSFHSEFTEDRIQLRSAASRTRATENRTMLYDALEVVMTKRLNQLPGRKAIVLFTDGVDNESVRISAAGILSRIEKSDVLVYAIQYDTRTDGMPDRFRLPPPQGQVTFAQLYRDAVKFLRNLTGHSGGRLYHAETIASLKEAFAQIAEEMRLQYTLCYYPAKKARAGSYRRIRVTVDRPGVTVRARDGYRAGAATVVK